MKGMAWRVGLFALAGLALLLAVTVGGGRWFAVTERAQMRFETSVFGLQVGAPVVFRGVRVGQVSGLALARGAAGGVAVPVTAEFDRALLVELVAPGSGGGGGSGSGAGTRGGSSGDAVLPTLIARGLVARLAQQSLLTGLLYVDIDLDPARAASPSATGAAAGTVSGLPVIPTQPSRLQTLQAQLEGLDLSQIGKDLALLAQSARQLMAGPQPQRALQHTADAALAIERLAQRLERELVPLSVPARETLAETRRAMQQLGQGAQLAGAAASAVQGQARTLTESATPLLAELRRTAEELSLAAAALRQASAEDSTLRVGAERALQDVSRAARSMRELSDTLERQPDLLLRGRSAPP